MQVSTFFFTDIEGSTSLYERAPQAYRAALDRHFRLLEEIIGQHGGKIFRNTGDGYLAVFDDPVAALRCGPACQRALAVEAWPEPLGRLRVRIGIHRGEAEPAGEDFHGLTMHHATRVLDAGHGGQVICSAAVAEEVGTVAGLSLRVLGLYRLRGVPTPMRLFQVDEIGAVAEAFPHLRTAPAFSHTLPSLPTRFFGRDAELRELARLLAPESAARSPRRYGRLVTLLGPGGTGKTRLSLAVGESLLAAYSHAVWFVPLAEVRDAALLPDSLLGALGLTPEAGVAPLLQVSRHLRSQPSLLILDNFEQLVPAGAETVRQLLADAPDLVCLVSSRIRLELQAEQDFALLPLRLPPATGTVEELLSYPCVQLFCDRARAGRRDFSLEEKNAAAIAQICRTLEGIPLAIELAAARTAVLTPQQVVARLGQRLDFLIGRQQDFADRHRTLRATVAWSYELLDPPLQQTFAELSLFRGGWSLAAAEALLAGAPLAALEQLTELQGCSLVIAEEIHGEMRFRMLEVIREFAQERLQGEAAEAARVRHHRYFHALACQPPEMTEAARLQLLEIERDNLRQMLEGAGPVDERADAAVALLPFWMIRGYFREGRSWLQLLRGKLGDPLRLARATNVEALLAWRCGLPEEARGLFEQALTAWTEFGNERNVAAVLNNLGILAKQSADYAAARDYLARSLAVFARLALPSEQAAALNNLGEIALLTADYENAASLLQRSLELQRASQEHYAMTNTLHNLAELGLRRGDWAAARRALGECLMLRAQLATPVHESGAFLTMISLAAAEGEAVLAARCLGALWQALRSSPAALAPALEAELEKRQSLLAIQLGAERTAQLMAAGQLSDLGSALDSSGKWCGNLDSLAQGPVYSAA